MGNFLESLKRFVFDRRARQMYIHRSDSYDSDSLSSNKSTTNEDTKSKVKPTSQTETIIKTTTVTKEATFSNVCSKFYLACRDNNIEEVEKLLETMTLDEIDKIEPIGSTALHVASYRGYFRIVKLLLEAGADRAILNKHNCLPFDEALNDDIKELFLRVPNRNRLKSDTGAIEWELIDDDVLEKLVIYKGHLNFR